MAGGWRAARGLLLLGCDRAKRLSSRRDSADDLLLAEGLDVGGGEAELAQDGVGVLAYEGRGGAHRAGRPRELDGDAELLDRPQCWMLHLHHHVAGLYLRVGDHLLRL